LNRFTPDSVRTAADYFQQAIEKDPAYPAAYTKLAGCYQILGGMGAIPKKMAYPKAKLLVAKALELDPQFAAAHAVRGWSLLLYELDFATAGAELKRAVELNPNGVEGHQGLGDYYAAMGRMQESVQEVLLAWTPSVVFLFIVLLRDWLYRRRRGSATEHRETAR